MNQNVSHNAQCISNLLLKIANVALQGQMLPLVAATLDRRVCLGKILLVTLTMTAATVTIATHNDQQN